MAKTKPAAEPKPSKKQPKSGLATASDANRDRAPTRRDDSGYVRPPLSEQNFVPTTMPDGDRPYRPSTGPTRGGWRWTFAG
jgi:hypothetical protein